MRKKDRLRFAWFLAFLGAIFLLGGLLVLIFAALPMRAAGPIPVAPEPHPSVWVTLADRVINFTIALLQVDWTPTRVGVFLIIVGTVLESGAGYLFIKK